MQIELREAQASDLSAILELLEEASLPTAGVESWLERFLVAEAGGRVVGAAGLEVHGEDGVLRSVVVHPSARRMGLGGRLTDGVVEAARSVGIRHLYLLTETAETYFRRRGFRRIEREEASARVRDSIEFREACPASAVAMVRELG